MKGENLGGTGLQGAFPMWGPSQALCISPRTLAPSLRVPSWNWGLCTPPPIPTAYADAALRGTDLDLQWHLKAL